MQDYLILYVDVEFIVGAISTGYGNPHIINIEGDILQWLYFFNDPHQHTVSFGKRYKKHYMDGEVNYYGKFLHSIENKDATFSLRHVDYPLIELLEVSGMLKMWEMEYNHTTQSVPETIPTLLTYSSSISDLAKQNFVDYLKGKGFDIKSYTIPLSELALKKLLIDGKINSDDGKATLMIEATNATLHFTKLVYHDQYFMKDGDVKSIQGKGIDPRKRALCKFLVGEMNSLTGLLSTEDEKEEEIERLEPQAADWLKKIDAQSGTRPFYIRNISFKIAKHITRDILVNKENLESDTGRYVQYLTDEYSAFKNEFCPNGISYCCFVGNCFVSDRIKERFESVVGKERAFFFRTTDVADIICVYPRIDLQRYADEENRIKAKAEADAHKQQAERDEQRKRDEAKAKADEEARRIAEEKQRKDSAEKAYQHSLDLDKQGNLEDAKANVDNAVNLVPEDLKYRQFADYLTDKIKKQRETLQLYKTYLLAGDKCCNEGKFNEALIEYEKAKSVDDNAEIKGKIIECNVRIKEQKKQKEKIDALKIEIEELLASKNINLSEDKIKKLAVLDIDDKTVNAYKTELQKIRDEKEELERQTLADLKKQLNNAMFAENWEDALKIVNNYLAIKKDAEIQKKKEVIQKKMNTTIKSATVNAARNKKGNVASKRDKTDSFFDEQKPNSQPASGNPKNKNGREDDFFNLDGDGNKQKRNSSAQKVSNDDFDF